MQNLNVDDVVDSTSDVESNEVVDNVIINENFKRINQTATTENVAAKIPKINVANLIIHRVICLYFMESLKNKKEYKPKKFLLNNPQITAWSVAKFGQSKLVIEQLQNLREKYGIDFLDQDKRVVWVTNKSLISLSLIPSEVLRDYSAEPNRYRAQRTFRTPKEGVEKFLPITSRLGVSSLFTTKKHLPINSKLATDQQIRSKSETITTELQFNNSDSDSDFSDDSSRDQQFNDDLPQSIVYVDDGPVEKVILYYISFNICCIVYITDS